MTKEELIKECLMMPDSFVDYPFDESTAVIKAKNGKMFAFLDHVKAAAIKRNCGGDAPAEDGDLFINLKCDPALCEIFRARYKAVLPGYYSNKLYWNTVIADKDVPFCELQKMILHSYELITSKKKK